MGLPAITYRGLEGQSGGTVSPYNSIAEAVLSFGSAYTVLVIPPGVWPITANLAIPANITLKPLPGAFITISTGVTVTHYGLIEAGYQNIFVCSGTGKVVFVFQGVVYAEWFGAVRNDPTNDTGIAVNLCIASLPNGGEIQFWPGTYYFATKVSTRTNIKYRVFDGMAAGSTVFRRTANITLIEGIGVSILDPAFNMNQIYRNSFKGIAFGHYDDDSYTANLLDFRACMNFSFKDCLFTARNSRALFARELFDSRFRDCYFVWSGKADGGVPVVELMSSNTTYETVNNIYWDGCVFESNLFTCIKTSGDVSGYPTNQISFNNTKFDNTHLTGPTLDFLNTWGVEFNATWITVQRNVAITELVKFDKCTNIKGRPHLQITPVGSAAIDRIMTINTDGGNSPCTVDLYLSGINWNAITEAAAVKIDHALQAPKINIRTFGPTPGDAGYLCSTKRLTNFPLVSEALYGSSVQTYAPAGGTDDWMEVCTHALASGGPDVWVKQVVEAEASSYIEWMLNGVPIFRVHYNGTIQALVGDFMPVAAGKGVILLNAAGTVIKRVRLNDAGDGLIFEAL